MISFFLLECFRHYEGQTSSELELTEEGSSKNNLFFKNNDSSNHLFKGILYFSIMWNMFRAQRFFLKQLGFN